MAQSSTVKRLHRSFSEQPIKIIVGSEEKIYYVHPSVLISCNSPVLNARMTGAWRNNDDKPLDWRNFDEITVECVISYLYTEDYYVPTQSPELGEPNGDDIKGKSEDKGELTHPLDNKTNIVQKRLQSDNKLNRPLSPLYGCIQSGLPPKIRPTAAGVFDQASKQEKENIGVEILTHAKVYIFAHYFSVHELEKLALQRLTQVLAALNDVKMQDLFPQLAEAIYVVYGGTLNSEQHQDPARRLLSQFVALRNDLLSCEDFYILLADGGEFSIDVTRKLVRRIAGLDDVLKSLSDCLSENTERLQDAENDIAGWEEWNSKLDYYQRRDYRYEDDYQ
ncbi:hypothetical protein Plec18170_004405 [Paecilomyces lecythidis]